MAQDEHQQQSDSTPRVHKASEVHKRRAGRKPRTRDAHPTVESAADDAVAASVAADVVAAEEDVVAPEENVEENVEARRPETAVDDQAVVPDDEQVAAPAEEPSDVVDAQDASGKRTKPTVSGRVARGSEAAPKKPKGKRIAIAVIAIVVLAAIAAASLFAWNRWGRYDDHLDLQGDWYVEGTATLVTIDEDAIHLADNVVYAYEIDDHDKTIRYTFGSWEGQGRYWFSDDRTHLVITDGEFSGVGNTVDDLVQSFDELGQTVTGEQVALPQGDGIIVFSREADPQALEKQKQAERAKKDSDGESEDAEGEEADYDEAYDGEAYDGAAEDEADEGAYDSYAEGDQGGEYESEAYEE